MSRDSAEWAIRRRIGRSKLLTKLIAGVALPASLVTGVAASKDVAADAVWALSFGGMVATAVDSRRRERYCDRIVARYADGMNAELVMRQIKVEDVLVDEEGKVNVSIADDSSSVMVNSAEALLINFPGFAGTGLAMTAAQKLVRMHDVVAATTELTPQALFQRGVLAVGIGSLVARDAALDREAGRYFGQMDNIAWSAAGV